MDTQSNGTSSISICSQQFKAVFECSGDAIIAKALDGTVLSWSPAAERIFGYSADEMVGHSILQIFPYDRREEEQVLVGKMKQGHPVRNFHTIRMGKDGAHIPVSISLSPILSNEGDICGALMCIRDISREIETDSLIEYKASHDALTELRNRAGFERYVNECLKKRPFPFQKCALVFLDLDDFKAYNHSFGHAFGNKLLQLAANEMAVCLRDSDELARFGADEFAICISNVNSIAEIKKVVQQLLLELSEVRVIEGTEVSLSASVGIAISGEDGLHCNTLIRKAEHAMYEAKRKGKNQFRFYSEHCLEEIEEGYNPVNNLCLERKGY